MEDISSMAYTSYIAYKSYMTYTSYIAYTSYMTYKSYIAYTSYIEENTVYNSQLYKIILNFVPIEMLLYIQSDLHLSSYYKK